MHVLQSCLRDFKSTLPHALGLSTAVEALKSEAPMTYDGASSLPVRVPLLCRSWLMRIRKIRPERDLDPLHGDSLLRSHRRAHTNGVAIIHVIA